jgi:hypothetical protein
MPCPTPCRRYWWFSPSGSPERRKIAFQVDGILQGPLLGKGVAIISNDPAGMRIILKGLLIV